VRDILRAAILAERNLLFQVLERSLAGQNATLLEEIAACDSLLERIGPARTALHRIREDTLRVRLPVKRKSGRRTGSICGAGARGLAKQL
jgi:hypothetical protein